MDLADFTIFTEPQQGASHDDLPAVARRAEHLGKRLHLQVLDLSDLDHLDLIAATLA